MESSVMVKRLLPLILLASLLTACAAAGTASSPLATATNSQLATPLPPTGMPAATPSPTAQVVSPGDSPAAEQSPTRLAGGIHNPVMDRDFPDPDVIDVGDTYYAYATNSNSMNILVASSTDLSEWKFLGNALPRAPRWASQGFGYNWAPEVSKFAGNYVMYFTTRFNIQAGGVQCIALAVSKAPEGPFVLTDQSNAKPFVCQQNEGGSIDPSVFTDEDRTSYLLWESDANSQDGQTWIYIQPLSADGMSLEGEPTRLITADSRWEGVLVEAPTLWKHEGKYYLFYSANDYASRNYAVGYAVADQPTGPYTKGKTNPILKTNIGAGIIGPGGQDVVVGPDGKTYMLFHSWTPQAYRALDVAPLEWKDGMPVVNLPARAPAGQ